MPGLTVTQAIEVINAIAANTQIDPETALREARVAVETHRKTARLDFETTYTTKEALRAAIRERDLHQPRANASKDTLVELLVNHYMANEISGIDQAITPLVRAARDAQDNEWAKEGAFKALEDWAKGEDHSQRSNYSEQQGEAYRQFLFLVGEWYEARIKEGTTPEEALRGLVFSIMQYGILHYETSLSHTYQIRVGDLDEHLGKRAGANYALRVIAPAALGVHEAQMLGIQREWYRN